jgi:cardiolipin synthase (CMP-forming)
LLTNAYGKLFTMINIPNTLTLLRFALVPYIALLLLEGVYATACVLFIIAALSDWADGVIARHWNQRTRFGAIADPLADKLTMLTVTLLLTYLHELPLWFMLAVILRDVLIVAGALAFHFLIGQLVVAPSFISKLNTALAFILLVTVLAIQAGFLPDGPWREALLYSTFITTVFSGAGYVYVWGRKVIEAIKT